MNTAHTSTQWLIILAFATIYLVWGTTYLVILIGLKDLPPFLMAAMRFTIAGAMLVSWCLFKGESVPSMHTIGKNSLVGLIILAGGQGILIWAEQYIASGYTAILVATLPIWFVILDKKQWHNCFSNKYIVSGLVIGFTGILLLFREHTDVPISSGPKGLSIIASMAVLFSCICWVGGSLYYKYRPTPGSMMSNLGWQLLGGAVFCFAISFFSGELRYFSIISVGLKAWLAVSYLAVAGSIAAFIAYNWLLTQKPSAIVGTYAYVNPVVAVLLGWLIADEVISVYQLTGMMVILFSALLINLSKYNGQKLQKR